MDVHCPENKPDASGRKSKTFLVSEDPKVIQSYIKETPQTLKKHTFSSALTGKIFATKEDVIEDFEKTQIRPMPLTKAASQNRFELHPSFVEWLEEKLNGETIQSFLESLSAWEVFKPSIDQWMQEFEEEDES